MLSQFPHLSNRTSEAEELPAALYNDVDGGGVVFGFFVSTDFLSFLQSPDLLTGSAVD